MKQRCLNPDHPDYSYYGQRGITICDQWVDDYDCFYTDMGLRPQGLTLERIDTNGNYEPENCKWATRKEQSRNKRTNHLLTIEGRTQTIAEWAEEAGIPARLLWLRQDRHGVSSNILRPPERPTMPDHGTRARYRRGCKCQECKTAKTTYERNRLARKRNESSTDCR